MLARAKTLTKRVLRPFTPHSFVIREKYRAELDHWTGEISNLDRWFNKGSKDWWGIVPPSDQEKLSSADLWQTNAVMTMHKLRPSYHEELQLDHDAFKGKRILEVGCGPLAPCLQFSDCERHGVDPLINLYIECGWPLFDYEAKFINAYGENLPYPDGYFDAVISVNALDHVDNFSQVAAEIERVTKPGGQIRFEVEYHEPTITEPLQLNDEIVMSAFKRSSLEKLNERGKSELFADIVRRFDLKAAGITDRFGSLTNDERFALWQGTR